MALPNAILTSEQALVTGDQAKEAVLRLWERKFSAKTIMEVLNLSEPELDNILPRSLWYYDKSKKCSNCGGTGSFSWTDQIPLELN